MIDYDLSLIVFVLRQGLICSPDWPGTFNLSASAVLGLLVCTTSGFPLIKFVMFKWCEQF
jgi:hypothetical protein